MPNLEDDSIFLRELKTGHRWQLWAGLQFLKAGLMVQVPPLSIRPTHADIDYYSDNGDIFIWRNSHDRLRLECKSRNLKFTGRQDYPYPTVFVDRVGTWNRKRGRKPAAILLVSQITGAILTVGSWTEGAWLEETKDDSVRGYQRNYYMAPIDILLEWKELINHIKGELI